MAIRPTLAASNNPIFKVDGCYVQISSLRIHRRCFVLEDGERLKSIQWRVVACDHSRHTLPVVVRLSRLYIFFPGKIRYYHDRFRLLIFWMESLFDPWKYKSFVWTVLVIIFNFTSNNHVYCTLIITQSFERLQLARWLNPCIGYILAHG